VGSRPDLGLLKKTSMTVPPVGRLDILLAQQPGRSHAEDGAGADD
jgi:hypothetical protein